MAATGDSERGDSAVALGTREIFCQVLDSRVRFLRDTDGRPLGEQRVPELYSALQTELQQCPYRGSRFKHSKPMNVSALRQMTAHWPAILGGLQQVHREYCGRVSPGVLSRFDLYQIIGMGILLPAYVTLRADRPLRDTEIPVWLSGVYKVLLGIHAPVGQLMIEELLSGGHPKPLLTPEEMLDHVESTGALIGKTEVCAGPAVLIRRALKVVITGSTEETIDVGPFRRLVDGAAFAKAASVASELLQLHFLFILGMRHRAIRISTLLRQIGTEQGPARPREEALSRLQTFLIGQSIPMADLCRRLERIQGVAVGPLMSALARRLDSICIDPEEPLLSCLGREGEISLLSLLEHGEIESEAAERAFRVFGAQLSGTLASSLGYAPDSRGIDVDDVLRVSGEGLAVVLRQARSAVESLSA